MTETRIDITAKDNTKAAFSSVDRSLTSLSSSIGKVTGLLGALGVGFSAVGAASAIKGVIDANDALAKMSQSTGIAVESLAGLEFAASQSGTSLDQVAKGVRRFSRLILESADGTDKYGKLIRALGLDLEELKNSTPEEQFIKLSGAIRDNVAEQERAVVVTSLFGNEYANLVPLLAQGEAGIRGLIEEGQRLNPVTAESAKKSEEFNDSLDRLGRSFDAIKVEAASSILPALNDIANEMVEVTRESGVLIGALSGVGKAFTSFFESDFFVNIVGASGPIGAFIKMRVEADKAEEALKEIESQSDETSEALKGVVLPELKPAIPGSFGRILKEINEDSNKASTATTTLNQKLSEEEKQAQATEKEIRALTLAYDPLIKRNEELSRLVGLFETGLLPRNVFDAAAKSAIEDYIRATQGAEESTKNVKTALDDLDGVSERVFESMSEFAIQGARNIQTALSDALLDGVRGFESFADNVLDIIKRLAANIASVKLLEGLGIGALLGSSQAVAGTNAFGGFSNAFGAGGSLINSFSTSGIGQALGLSQLSPGPISVPTLTGAGSALSSFTNAVFPAVAGSALGIGIGSSIAGDSKVFGASGTVTSAIGTGVGTGIGAALGGPLGAGIGAGIGGVVSGIFTKVFGREPFEPQETRLLGDVTTSGFTGATNIRATSKGGLLRSNRTDNILNDVDTGELLNAFKGIRESGISSELSGLAENASKAAVAIGGILDTNIQNFVTSINTSAEILGVSTSALDNFSTSIDIVSEKGKALTDQEISAALDSVADSMANALVPGLQDLAREGEGSFAALARVTQEFTSLEDALIVFGVSAEQANAAISALSIATRTELVDAAGGIESLNSQITFFANNFLSAEEQLNISFSALDAEMQALGLSADITVEEFKNLVISVTQAGGASVELASALLQLAPTFLNVKNAEAQLAAESASTSGQVNSLSGSVAGLGASASNTAATIQASFARIDTARANLAAAENALATAQARSVLSDAQGQLAEANNRLSIARSNLSAAQSAEQQRESAARQGESDAINNIVSERSKLISAYQQEASALKGVVDRFGALSDRILDFKDSLAISNLSPFSPGEQLAIARQQFNETRGLAAQGDENALNRLPEVSRTFLEASKTFNGATGAFESDFNFVQQVLESSGATAQATRDIAADQLAGIEGTISELQALNDATQNINRNVGVGFDNVTGSLFSVEEAMAQVESATADVAAAQANIDSATLAVEQAVREQDGAFGEVESATRAVESAVDELTAAVLQGFGNAFISDQQIRDFVIANQNLTDQQFLQLAVAHNINTEQLARALAPLGVTTERINTAAGGLSVRDSQINDFVNANINNPFAIYEAARANGISSERLAASSGLSKEEIDQFVRANNLQPFEIGTDFVRRDGIAMLHKGEAVVPSSTTSEIKKLREELAQLRREQNQQMNALINTNIQANKENAQAIAKSNERLANGANWQQRSRPKVA